MNIRRTVGAMPATKSYPSMLKLPEVQGAKEPTAFERTSQAIKSVLKFDKLVESYLETIMKSTFNFEDTFITFTERYPDKKEWTSSELEKFVNTAGSSLTAINSVISVYGNTKIKPPKEVTNAIEGFVKANSLQDSKDKIKLTDPSDEDIGAVGLQKYDRETIGTLRAMAEGLKAKRKLSINRLFLREFMGFG